MKIKNLKGSVSLTDFIDDLCTATKSESLGELWENNVGCSDCKYREQCQALGDEFEEITCSQVIDHLLGDQDLV